MKQNSSQSIIENPTEKLEFFSLFINLDKIAWVWAREKTSEQKKALAQIYKELTGNNIESRLAHLGANVTKI